jgi:hypothetical protein
MYAYKENNQWVYPVNLTSRFNGIGGWHTLTDEARAQEDFYRLKLINETATPQQIRSTFADIVLDEETLICTGTYTLSEKSLRYYKDERIREARVIREAEFSARPQVDTGLGFSVDGSAADLRNFEIGKRLGLLFVKDADGASQTIISNDWDTIINAVSINGLSILQKYWDYKEDIANCTSLDEVQAVVIEAVD